MLFIRLGAEIRSMKSEGGGGSGMKSRVSNRGRNWHDLSDRGTHHCSNSRFSTIYCPSLHISGKKLFCERGHVKQLSIPKESVSIWCMTMDWLPLLISWSILNEIPRKLEAWTSVFSGISFCASRIGKYIVPGFQNWKYINISPKIVLFSRTIPWGRYAYVVNTA